MVKDKVIGVIAAATAYFIFGISIVVCKDLLNSGAASPSVLLEVRFAGAAFLFWLASALFCREKVEKADILKLFFASLIGMSVPQSASMYGLTMSTPLDASLINSLKPLFAIFASFVIFGTRQNRRTWVGVLLAIVGVIVLILSGGKLDEAFKTTPLGLLIWCVNGLSFAFYLAIFKSLVRKYHPLTFMKWQMLFSMICLLPAALKDIYQVNLEILTPLRYLELAFLVVIATFLTYLLSPIAQKRLTPTQYCVISYVQPLTAAALSIVIGLDVMTIPKLCAVVLIIIGGWLTNSTYEKNPSSK